MFDACVRAVEARPEYQNGISLDSISWSARARSLSSWLEKSIIDRGAPSI
jgi:hypothetical protein